jgi:outer membrane protein assembly factor BamE (lipoprotein component of BamABCDE complex)
MRAGWQWIRTAAAAGFALGLAACAPSSTGSTASRPPAAPAVVLEDQLVDQIKRGETKMDQVRALISAKPLVNYQAGREIWIYQGVADATGTLPRTVTVQFDERGIVRNIGKVDLPK